jgi:hypothetical protein
MASIESRIDTFIAENGIDAKIKDELCVLVTGCMEDLFKHVFNQPVPESENKKAKKVLKAEKVEDPTTCENYEDLRNCTTGVLNQFCKDHGLKVGGNKKEIMDRVWRHIQGESSDEDKSSRGKPKKEKKVPEKHTCAGTNVAGVPCGSSGTEEFGGCHFCWRHITDAQKFIDAQESKGAETEPAKVKKAPKKAKETEQKPAKTEKPAAKVEKPAATPKPRAKFVPKKPEPEPELVTEDEEEVEPEEEESEEEVEEDQSSD